MNPWYRRTKTPHCSPVADAPRHSWAPNESVAVTVVEKFQTPDVTDPATVPPAGPDEATRYFWAGEHCAPVARPPAVPIGPAGCTQNMTYTPVMSGEPAVPVMVAGKAPVTVRVPPSARSVAGVTVMPGVNGVARVSAFQASRVRSVTERPCAAKVATPYEPPAVSEPAGIVRVVENAPSTTWVGRTHPETTQPPWPGTCPGCQSEALPTLT